jgi:hypothetical protein
LRLLTLVLPRAKQVAPSGAGAQQRAATQE